MVDDWWYDDLRTKVQYKLLVLLVNCYSKGQGSFLLTRVTRVQSSTIEYTNISEARLKLLISGTNNNCLWLFNQVHNKI